MFRKFFLYVIFLIFSGTLQGQHLSGGLPFFTNYHPSDYKGYSQNWAITSNSKGLLFFANGDGVMLYNGRSWSKILLNNNATPSSFYCDENDLIWVGAQSELGVLVPDQVAGYRYVSLTFLIPDEFREFGFILSIVRSRDGMYFKTATRIFRLVDRQIYTIPCERGSHMFEFKNNIFLYEQTRGFSSISGNKLLRITGQYNMGLFIRSVVPLNDHELLMLDGNKGLFKATFDFTNPYAFQVSVEAITNRVNEFLANSDPFHAIRLSDGRFAFATQRDGTLVADSNLNIEYHLSRSAGVMNETHNFLFEDLQGNMWIALDHGICKVNARSPLCYFNDYQGVNGSVLDVSRFGGRLFVATWQGVFYEKRGCNSDDVQVFTPLKEVVSQTWDFELCKLGGKQYLLVSTSDGLLAVDSMLHVTLISAGNYNFAKSDVTMPERIYAGGPGKIEFIDVSRGLHSPQITQVPDLKSRVVNAVLASGNRFFAGTARDGVFVFSAERLTPSKPEMVFTMEQIGVNEGLPQSDAYYVYLFHEKILVGTQHGLFQIEKQRGQWQAKLFSTRFREYYTDSKFINILRQDESGNMWFQTNSKLSGKKSLYYLDVSGTQPTVISQPFQTFPDIEFYSITTEGDSLVWFGSDDGVFCFKWSDCRDMKLNASFSTVLQKVSYKGKTVYSGIHTISGNVVEEDHIFNDGHLRFDFAAGYYVNETQVRFRYKLDGYDRSWSEPTLENYKEYTGLPSGSYTFRVKAVNPFGTEGVEAFYHFSIPSPWYLYWWVLLLFAVGVTLLVIGVVRMANRRLIKAKLRLENIVHSRTLEIQNQKKAIEIEKEKADKLLINILPVRIAEELKTTGRCQTEFYQNVSVLFTDFSGFTSIAENMDPEQLVAKLDMIFAAFDDICSRNKLEKIKTIGDSHMSAGGIPARNRTHAVDAVLAAMEMQQYLENLHFNSPEDQIWRLRIGINSGELTAGVVGKRKFAFDIWGDTVNTASRLQDAGEAGRINISNRTAALVSTFFDLTYRGKKPIKHKGEVDMFFVDGIRKELSINGERNRPNQEFWNQYNALLDLRYLNF